MGYSSEQELIAALIDAYYSRRDVEGTLACVTDDIKWVGTENNDSAEGKTELRTLLEADVAAFDEPFQIEVENVVVQNLADTVTMIWVTARQVEVPGVVCGFTIRGTATCLKTESGWLVANIHVSVPNTELEKYSLQHELDETRKKEQVLMDSIPGGTAIYRMKKDGRVVVEYLSEGFAKLCGFATAAECIELLGGEAKNGIPEEDWNRIYASIARSVQSEKSIRENYSIYSKSGQPLEITMDANVLPGSELAEDDVALLYAVHTIISDEEKMAEQERERYHIILDMLGLAYWEWSSEKGCTRSEEYNRYAVGAFTDIDDLDIDAYLQCVHPDDAQLMLAFMAETEPGTKQKSVILRAKMRDGSYRWTEMIALTEVDEAGNKKRIITVMRDMDEAWLKQREELEFDELTRANNRRFVEKHLQAYINNAKEQNSNLGLAMVDLDHFKGLNDAFGHLAGDVALKNVSRVLAEHFAISKGDFVARFGGDEFMVVCRNIPKHIFEERLQQVVKAVRQLSFEQYPGMRVRISIGSACTEDMPNCTELSLVKAADEYLYKAKETGRNRAVSG